MNDDPKILPPRKKNWKPGHLQVGLFLRTEDGAVIEACWDDADPLVKRAALKLLRGGGKCAQRAGG